MPSEEREAREEHDEECSDERYGERVCGSG